MKYLASPSVSLQESLEAGECLESWTRRVSLDDVQRRQRNALVCMELRTRHPCTDCRFTTFTRHTIPFFAQAKRPPLCQFCSSAEGKRSLLLALHIPSFAKRFRLTPPRSAQTGSSGLLCLMARSGRDSNRRARTSKTPSYVGFRAKSSCLSLPDA